MIVGVVVERRAATLLIDAMVANRKQTRSNARAVKLTWLA